jgi:hypothetical protein
VVKECSVLLKKEKEMETLRYAEQVEWVKHLPNQGGEWGRGIVGTVGAVQAQVAKAEAERAELARQISQGNALLKATVKRAVKESVMLYSNSQIAEAKEATQAPQDQ